MPKAVESRRHYLLGLPAPLPLNKLPSKGEVINYLKLLAERESLPSRRTPTSSVYHKVADEVRKRWQDKGIPIYDKKFVLKKIRGEYKSIKKSNKTPRADRHAQCSRSNKFKFKELFDIAKCKCKMQQHCLCPRDARVPPEGWVFLCDQRQLHSKALGSIDQTGHSLTLDQNTSSLRNVCLHQQNTHLHCYQLQMPSRLDTAGDECNTSRQSVSAATIGDIAGPGVSSTSSRERGGRNGESEADSGGSGYDNGGGNGGGGGFGAGGGDSDDDDGTWLPFTIGSGGPHDDIDMDPLALDRPSTTERSPDWLMETARAAERYGVSDRATAAIINAFQMDIGLVTAEDRSNLVDPEMIRRARSRIRTVAVLENGDAVHEAGLSNLV